MKSMTGYSKVNFENDDFRVKIEIKSVNNKNLNLKIKMPYILNFMENKIKSEFSNRISRGSVDLRIEFEDKREQQNLFEYDKNMANSYMQVLNDLEQNYQQNFSNKLDVLIKQPNLIKKNDLKISHTEYQNLLIKILHQAIDEIVIMKKSEGLRMKEYFIKRIDVLEDKVDSINKLKHLVVENYRKNLINRLDNIKKELSFDENEILKEILLFTDRCDISEELSRLASHIIEFKKQIEIDDSIGKKLDFILQEMFRELNTTGVKCNLYDISKLVVEAKNEVEKIREQVMNIE